MKEFRCTGCGETFDARELLGIDWSDGRQRTRGETVAHCSCPYCDCVVEDTRPLDPPFFIVMRDEHPTIARARLLEVE